VSVRKSFAALWFAAVLGISLATAGCDFYFGGGDDDCNYGGAYAEPDAAGYRNPFSGQCEYTGGGGGGGCGVVPATDVGAPEAADWAQCYSYCTGLDEQGCMATSGCRAIYRGNCPEGLDCGIVEDYTYVECWATAPSGPVQGGGCEGLDAYECSRHDDCVARHYPAGSCSGSEADCAPGYYDPTGVGAFESCAAEAPANGCYGNEDCGPNERCNAAEVCLPPPGNGNGDCDPATPDCGGNVPTVCYGYCVPDAPDKGTCTGDVLCDVLPPKCPPDSVPGIRDGCWSGYCIPVNECETQTACGDIANEYMCIARDDCSPIYEGINCTCDGGGLVPTCTCESWQFKSCEADQPPPQP